MNMQNVFEDEWRACLRAHFFHVIKERDSGNERSLVTVLLQTGFTEDAITAMRSEAVMELGWTPDAASDSTIEPDFEDEPLGDTQAELQTPTETASEGTLESELPPPVAKQERDEPEGPPVQLSLF